MAQPSEGKPRKYPFSMGKVYINLATIVMAIVLASALLTERMWVLYYALSTSIIAAISFVLKSRSPTVRRSLKKENSLENEEKLTKPTLKGVRRILLLVLAIGGMASPFLLAGFLEPYIWFILIISLASGISISEILLYVYCERRVI